MTHDPHTRTLDLPPSLPRSIPLPRGQILPTARQAPVPGDRRSSSSAGRSSPRPQRFPENVFLLENTRPEDKVTPQIFLPAGDGNIPSMRKLAEALAREGKSVGEMTVKDPLRRTLGPLHFAAWSGKLEMCRFLIKDHHLDVNADADRAAASLKLTSTYLA